MPRDGFGTYSVPNTFLPNTVMSATAVNQNFTDAGSELTNSLARDGQSSMSGQFKAWDGTASSSVLPGIAFGLDVNTGFRRASEDEMRWVTGGVDRFYIDSAGKAYQLGALAVTGTATLGSAIVLATTSSALLTLRRTENDTTPRTVEQWESGSGAGADGDLQVVGGGANDVQTMRWRVNSAAVFEATQSLFTHAVDTAIGSNIRFDTDGYVDMTEIAAPGTPGANVARLYTIDDGAGATRIAFKDAAGTQRIFGQITNRQEFNSSNTWTKPATGTIALIQSWGAGASGGRAGTGDGGGGGGGGAYLERYVALTSLSASVSVTIGAGGNAQTVDDTAGNAGGQTSFGAYLSAYGGGGGNGNSTTGGGGGGGGGPTQVGVTATATAGGLGGFINIGSSSGEEIDGVAFYASGNSNPFGGGGGGTGASASGAQDGGGGLMGGGGGGGGETTSTGGAGGFSMFGGGGGGGGSSSGTAGAGGTAVVYGGGGGAGATGANVATSGTAPSGGGGGSTTGNSGAGAAGRVVVTVW